MTYDTIPSFSNLDYKAEIRDKVLNPLIEQHNKHSEALESLGDIPASADKLNLLVDHTNELLRLADVSAELNQMADQSKDILKLSNEAGIISGLDGRVTALEIRKLKDEYASSGDDSWVPEVVDLKNRVSNTESDITKLKSTQNTLGSDLSDIEVRVDALELSGGGSGGTVDLTPVLNRIKDVEDDVVALLSEDVVIKSNLTATIAKVNKNVTDISDQAKEVSSITSDLSDHDSRITSLESAPPGVGGPAPEPTKWYVLPLGGQSNCVGYGETLYNLEGFDAPSARIKQLGRYNTVSDSSSLSDLTVNKVKCSYGSLFDDLRPDTDCNLKIIPATPCLDHIQNMFQHNKQGGGTVGSGMYLARALLPYIPEDYGILIVPSAYGGTGFTSGTLGSWNSSKLRAENARKHGADTPLGKDLFYRTKYALELNEENVLLPFVWIQGENDKDNSKGHYDGFKGFFDWFKALFESEGLQRFLPEKRMDNFRFICMGPTKWWLGADTEVDYIKYGKKDWETYQGSDVPDRVSSYNNYVFLSNLYKGPTGKQLIFGRADVDSEGLFVETNRERGTGDTTSNRSIHFSTRGYSYNQADVVSNIILRYSGLFPGQGKFYNRPVWGGSGTVCTDNVVNTQFVCANYSKLSEGLVVHSDFSTGVATENKVTSSAVITAGSSATLVADPAFGKVLNQKGTAGTEWVKYELSSGNTSYTKAITFKRDLSLQTQSTAWIMPYSQSASGGAIWQKNNGFILVADYNPTGREDGLLAQPAIECNWNGGFDGWNHLALVYSKEFKKYMVFLNGNLVSSAVSRTSPVLDGGVLGNVASGGTSSLFKGSFANIRMYERALSHEEIKALAETDLFSKI